MFRDRRVTRGPAGRDRDKFQSSSRFSGTRGAGRWSSGRVGKSYATKSAVDRKVDNAKFRLAGRGALNQNKNKKTQKGEKSEAEKTEDVYRQKVQISPDPIRKCVDNEIEQIQEALLDALEPLEDGYYPQFYGSYMVKGALVISCANEQSKKWLEKIVPTLVPWEGGKLCVKPKGEIVQGTQVILKTPKLFAKTEPKKILQMLSTQNKTLDTKQWKNISVKSEDSGQTLVYVVDNQSLEAIRALDNKVYLGLGNVELVIKKNEKEEEEDGKETSVDTEMTPSEETPPEKTPSEKTPSEKTPSEKTPSEKTPSEKTPSEKTPPEKTPPEKTPPEKTPPEKTSPEKSPPEKSPPEKTPPEKTPSEETPTEKPPTVKTEKQ